MNFSAEIINIYKTAQLNKRICITLMDRVCICIEYIQYIYFSFSSILFGEYIKSSSLKFQVQIVELSTRKLHIFRYENESFFNDQNYSRFSGFTNTVRRIHDFAKDIFQINGINKYLKARSINPGF